MKITLKQLEALGACKEGIAWYKQVGSADLLELVKCAIKEKEYTVNGEKFSTLDFANWGIVRLMERRQRTLCACFATKQVLKIFEDKYPDDKRPRAAIEAAEKWALNPSEDNRSAAKSAESAAWSAAKSAASAASAAWSAAKSAAESAASAAESAASAAWSAAESAAKSAARDRMKAKIIRYGVKLLLEKEQNKWT